MGTVYFSGSGAGTTSSGNEGIPTSICTNLRKTQSGTTVLLRWKDPNDTIIDGLTLCTWDKTIIVRKSGSYPETEIDGTVILTNTTRNAYNLTAFEDTLPDEENEYYYRAFPVSVNGVVCLDPQNKFGQVIYEFLINPNDSDPATCVKYLGTNENYQPAYMDYTNDVFNYGDWEKAFFIGLFRPCMLNTDGAVKYYLNPNDYAFQEDGVTPSEIADTSQSANAMVEIGQVWIKEVEENGMYHIYIANEQVSDDYDCYTHINTDGTYRDVIYRAMYDGSNINSVLRSLSGQAICKTVAGNTQIAYAQANGDGWSVDEYNLRRMINYLLVLMGKSLDTQTVYGTGRYSGGSSTSNNQLNTGTLDKKGMFYGNNSNGAVKVFHIENWWGNIWKITLGILQYGGILYYKMCEGLLDGSNTENYYITDSEVTAGYTNYINSGVTMGGTSGGYISKMTLVPSLGLVPTTVSGSSSTYYCDGAWWTSTIYGFARFGGYSAGDLLIGAFFFACLRVCSFSVFSYGASLSYKKPL